MYDFGTVKIHLEELLQQRGLSKSKLLQRASMQRTQVNRYCNNDIIRLDVDVLARICNVLDCKIEDLLEYIPPEKARENE